MIGTLQIAVSAARPDFPLRPVHAFVGSAVSLVIQEVPRPFGVRTITGVTVTAKGATGSATAFAATAVGNDWSVTIPASFFAATGTVERGIVISAAGKDETGAAVSNWTLGAADLVVMPIDGSVAPGESYQVMRWHDTRPASPIKGDVAPYQGQLYWWNGSAWTSFGGGSDGTAVHYTADTGKTDAEKAQARTNIGAANATHSHAQSDVTGLEDALAAKRDKTDLFTLWTVDETYQSVFSGQPTYDSENEVWRWESSGPDYVALGQRDATSLTFEQSLFLEYPPSIPATRDILAKTSQIPDTSGKRDKTDFSVGEDDTIVVIDNDDGVLKKGGGSTVSDIEVRGSVLVGSGDAEFGKNSINFKNRSESVIKAEDIGQIKFGWSQSNEREIVIGKDGSDLDAIHLNATSVKKNGNEVATTDQIPQNPATSFAAVGGVTPTIVNGEARLTDLFAKSDTFATDHLLKNSVLQGAVNSLAHYPIGAASATLADRAINAVTVTSAAVSLTFPAATNEGTARDFLILVDASGYAEGGSLAITLPSGATQYGDDFPAITAAGTYLVTVTEIAANAFYVRSIELEEVE